MYATEHHPVVLLTLFVITVLLMACEAPKSPATVTVAPQGTELIAVPIANIDPVALCPLFKFGSDHTGLQREDVLKTLVGKIVQWRLQVYEIKSTNKPDLYRVQTKECNDSSENRNIPTIIDLSARNDADTAVIHSLKTGDWFTVRGKVAGTFMRSIELSPAIIMGTEAPRKSENDLAPPPSDGVVKTPPPKRTNSIEDLAIPIAIKNAVRKDYDYLSHDVNFKTVVINADETEFLIRTNDGYHCGSGGCATVSYRYSRFKDQATFQWEGLMLD